jgi:hypothetical protein
MTGISIACNLAAFTSEQRHRHTALSQQLAQVVQEVRELTDGYAFRYKTDETTWLLAAEYVDLERRCCPFFTFTLIREAGGEVWLQLTGPQGVKDFLVTQLPRE